MRVSGKKVGLLVATLVAAVSVGQYSMHTAAHASTSTIANARNAAPQAVAVKVTSAPKQVTEDKYASYLQVLENIHEDPEHTQAKMVTGSYAIR